jgi:hypothetical protein
MSADIQAAEQAPELIRVIDVVVAGEERKEQALAELTRPNEYLIGVVLVFQEFNIPGLVHIRVVVGDEVFEVAYTVGQSFDIGFHLSVL